MKRLVGILLACMAGSAAAQLLDYSAAELRSILRHGPWPAAWSPDPSNRLSGNAQAIDWGRQLFFEPRLSKGGAAPCARCHLPARSWQDGLPRGHGLEPGDRNTLSLLNVRYQRWFGWDGAGDSLWAQSIRPIIDAREMGLSPGEVAALVRGDAQHACGYEKSFGVPPPGDDEALLAGVGKALAAFQETLVSARTPFDDFRDALERGDRAEAARYPLDAQRGLRIFVGRGACNLCHVGPTFSNGEFDDIGVPFFIAPGKVDPGRHGGIVRLRQNPFNLLGRHSDDATRASATRTRHVALEHRNFGEFKVPGLRNVAQTAPYTHHGRLATLEDVIRHYSDMDPDRIHSDGVAILRPLKLDAGGMRDLAAFLASLSEREPAPLAPPLRRACGSPPPLRD
ncbi:MAG: cytochrome-c peroxidase [Burkholderiales bacterium]